MATEFIQFGSKRIDFHLSYSYRKSLGITITPDMDVVVKAPLNAEIQKIKEKLKKKAPWIIKQQSYFLAFHPKAPQKKYVSGESHLYLGRQFMLRVSKGKKNEVKYKGRSIEVITKEKSKAKQILKHWYREQAKKMFATIAEPIIQRFKKYNVEPTGIFIQEMPTRWGSCTTNGKIILNPALVMASKHCIEYVIVHELCHLVHRNHTEKFFALQTKEMPDWEKWKTKLEQLEF